MARVAVYARLSLDLHGDQLATRRQLDACEKYAALREWSIAEVFEDVDLSAYKNVRRPGYEAMLERVANGDVAGVLVWKLDRLVRRPAEFERFWAVCESRGAFLASVTEPIDSSNELGLALVRILVTFAALESATTSLRMRARHEQAARRGAPPPRAAYGFRKGWQEHCETEAAVIRELAARVLNGETLIAIARDLGRRGVPSPSGGTWSTTGISTLLRYPRNVGDRSYRGEVVATDCFPPILSRVDYARLAVILRRPGRQAKRGLFSGVVVCGRCGARLYPHGATYKCSTDNGCGRLAIHATHLEAHVLPRLFHHAERLREPAAPSAPSDTAAWARDLDAASRRMSIAYNELRAGTLSYSEYLEQRRRVERDLAVITHTLPEGAALCEAWPTLSHEERQGVLARDIERITVQSARRTGAPFDPTRIRIRWWTKVDRRPEVEPTYRAALAGAFARRGRHASRWLTLDETAVQAGGVSTRSVLRFVLDGQLPAYRDGQALLFRAHEVEDFIAASRIVSAPANSETAERERRTVSSWPTKPD